MQSYIKIQGFYSNRVNLHKHYSFYIYIYIFSLYLEDEIREWMLIVVYEEKEIIRTIKKI